MFWLVILIAHLAPGPLVTAVTLGRVDTELNYSGSFVGALRMPCWPSWSCC